MPWGKREAVTNLVVLGEDEGQKKKVGGLLIGTPRDRMYPDKVNYELVQRDGETVLLSGSASLGRQINTDDIGKFVKCEFTGWGKSANGKFKMVDVFVYEGDVTPEMKAWPRYAEFNGNGQKRSHTPQTAQAATRAPLVDEDFPPTPLEDDDDDLPF